MKVLDKCQTWQPNWDDRMDAMRYLLTGTGQHLNYFKKKFMKPKYDIDQKVYCLQTKQQGIITGVQKKPIGYGSVYSYQIDGEYIWYLERDLSLTSPDDKKYFILYRSKDRLERTVEFKKMEYNEIPKFLSLFWDKRTCGIPTCTICDTESREYGFIKEESRDDGKTVVYVYEEF